MHTRIPSTRRSRVQASRWLVVVVLSMMAGMLLVKVLETPTATAQVSVAGESGKYLAVAGQLSNDEYGLYLIDREKGVIAVYQWQPNPRKLRLLAARNTEYDLNLDEYNTEPSPNEIQTLVRQSRRLSSVEAP